MAARHTNLGLLVLLAWALATGGLAFAIGAGWEQWVVVAHGALGLGLLVLAPWKTIIARRGLRRQRSGSTTSVVLAGLVLLALASGVAHATGLLRTVGPLTAMQVHVAAALGSIPFALWHLVERPVRPRRTDLSRRTILRAGAVGAGSLAALGGLAGVVRLTGLPGRRTRFTGSYRADPAAFPVTQWLSDGVPEIDASNWRLSILRRGEPARGYPLDELDARAEAVTATLDCTGGWFADATWHGVRLDRLLEGMEGRGIRAVSATGYSRRFPVDDADRLWVATRVEGRPLSPGHGAPARILAPGRRGFWWVKWLVSIEVDDTPWWWQPPFPVQ